MLYKEPVSVNASNFFGVNLLEQQRMQHTHRDKSETHSDSPITASDGNILCESVTNPAEESNCIIPTVT